MRTPIACFLFAALSSVLAACPAPSGGPDAGDQDAFDAPDDTPLAPDVTRDCGTPLALARPRPSHGAFDYPRDSVLRVNHIQAEATHNSYHIRPTVFGPDWNYTHAPLDAQLEQQGVRGFELDTHYEPRCGCLSVY
ncbi:MAG: hypothetical protein WCJ30_08510, partial [Deltaproteobacteria bacterium]